jgi:hypothetical protein
MSFSGLFCHKCKLILYLQTMYIYCVYPTKSTSPKPMPNCLKLAETSVIIIVFNGVLCEVSAYSITVSYCRSTRIAGIGYQKSYIRSMTK